MVAQGNLGNALDIDRRKLDVAAHEHEAAGIVHMLAVSPAGKYLAVLLKTAAVHDARLCAELVLIAVAYDRLRQSVIADGVLHADGNGADDGIGKYRLIDVYLAEILIDPAENSVTRDCLEDIGGCDDGADRKLCACGLARKVNDRQGDGLLLPVGVEHQVLCRHGLSGKAEGQSALGDLLGRNLIPALEHCVLADACGTCGNKIFIAVKRGFKRHGVVGRGAVVIETELEA